LPKPFDHVLKEKMSEVVGSIGLAALTTKKQSISDEVLVGKDVLELLAGAMYAEPLTIYREYIQNAADAIDDARSAGLEFNEPAGVQITVDRANRSVLIRDNGTSVRGADFVRQLTTIGASAKRGRRQRGFRGVGRLSGLGYCQELVFRGRAEGDKRVTEMVWDGRRLRELLRDASFPGGLSDLVKGVVGISTFAGDGYTSRFFEVELRKVTRLRGDLLLDEGAIRSYLAQVAPVPFSPEFSLGERIQAFLDRKGAAGFIDVRFTGEEDPIYHRARDAIEFNPRVSDRVSGVEFLELLGEDGEVCAFGWMLEHAYFGSMPKRLGLGGLRLRTGNIQIGNEELLSGLFPEPRFSGWAIAELHVISPKIVPNGRRDDFEPSIQYAHLQDELRILTKRIAQTIREQSDRRNRLRKMQSHLAIADQWLEQAREESPPPVVAERVRSIIDSRVADARKVIDKLAEGSPERKAAEQRVTKLLATQRRLLPAAAPRAGVRRTSKVKALEVALSVILENASSPHAGLKMSQRLISAFES